MRIISLIILLAFVSCKEEKKEAVESLSAPVDKEITYAKGFSIKEANDGIKILEISSPWPQSDAQFTYALVPREKIKQNIELDMEVDALIPVPVQRIIVTSTTHIPALESLGVADRLIGFPETDYISSPLTRELVDKGIITELGTNESLNTEIAIALEPDLIVGFGIDNRNKAYQVMESIGIPVVYNGDWTEETPLGKAEWIKFFGPFFEKENEADSIFRQIEKEYIKAREIAKTAAHQPTVLSGALYKDVWYLPAGDSWAANFIKDANAQYLWENSSGTGSLSLSIESVLAQATDAEIWISPSQFTSFDQMQSSSDHYLSFRAFQDRKVYTFAKTRGATGGLLYYELAPSRPDMVLKDLIYIFHPDLQSDYEPYFFKSLD